MAPAGTLAVRAGAPDLHIATMPFPANSMTSPAATGAAGGPRTAVHRRLCLDDVVDTTTKAAAGTDAAGGATAPGAGPVAEIGASPTAATARRTPTTTRRVAAVAVVAVATALVAAGCGGAASGSNSRSLGAQTVPGRAAAALATVGPLFPSAGATIHICTASVVDSPGGDLLVTAAHCVVGRGAGLVFVPGYDNGRQPYGRWTVVAAYAGAAWTGSQDPRDDVAFLKVAPHTVHGKTVEVQQVTGANRLASAPAAGRRVTVVGYAFGGRDAPIVCDATSTRHQGYPRFACAGYVAGTSGGPWLTGTAAQRQVVGVIGGLHQGGCRPDVSYSAPFGATTATLYRQAVRQAAPATLPVPGPDGCSG